MHFLFRIMLQLIKTDITKKSINRLRTIYLNITVSIQPLSAMVM